MFTFSPDDYFNVVSGIFQKTKIMKRILILVFAILLISVYVSHCIAQDLKYKAQLMCNRRDVKFKKIESVPVAMELTFGLADQTAILPAVSNAFYYIESITYMVDVVQVTAGIKFRFTNYGGGTPGGLVEWLTGTTLPSSTGIANTQGIECDSMLYIVNGNTAGSLSLVAIVFKITYE